MKRVKYEDVPRLCDQLLEEVESTGVTIEITKGGKPFVRMMPVDDATRAWAKAQQKR